MMPSSFTAYPCLQLCSLASRHLGFGRTNEPVAVGSERCRPSPSATLGTSTPARLLQGRDARSSVADWHFATDDCCLVTDALESRATNTFHSELNMRCDKDIQHLRRESICSCWTRIINSLPLHLKEADKRSSTIDSGSC